MRKTGAALAMALLVTAAAGTFLVRLGKANPFDLPVYTGIRIYSPNYALYQDRQSENGTVTINIAVILVCGEYDQSFTDAHLDSVCYSLDGQPLVYVYNFAIENITDYGRDRQDFFRCSTSVRLENLSDGNHTVTAYANDTHSPTAYINSQSASYNFTVNSHYQVPVVKILSPISQTYSDAAPLIFTVNGEVKEAHCYMYRGESPYEAVYERSFTGNTSLHNLPDGKYVMYLYVTTENGQALASTFFKMSNTFQLATGEEENVNPWILKEPMPVAGAYFKAGVLNDKIYVVDSKCTYEYDLQSWSTRKPMPTYRGDFALSTYQNKIYCIGGRTNNGPSGTNEVYDPASDSWESRAAMPTPRHSMDANGVNGKIYVIGGLIPWSDFPNVNLDIYTTFKLTNVNEVYDPATDTWATKSPIPNAASYYASAVVNNKIYIISENVTREGKDPYGLTQIYDPETDTWTYGAAPPYSVEMASAVTVDGVKPQRIYVVGGRQEGFEVDYNQAYNPENDSWSLGSPLPTARFGLVVAVAKGRIYAIGGLSGFLYNAVWANKNEQYDPLKDETLPSYLNPEQEESFPTVPLVAISAVSIAAVAVAGLLVTRGRRRKGAQQT